MSLETTITTIAKDAKRASRVLAQSSTAAKNRALHAMAVGLRRAERRLLAANAGDVAAGRRAGLSAALLDRLTLTPQRIEEMCRGIEQVAGLPDPVGAVLRQWRRPNGLRIRKVRVPLGVIGIIYESRPNVTADCAALCLKSGNSTILRGGSEALRSNRAIADVLRASLRAAGLPAAAIAVLPTTDRRSIDLLTTMTRYVDLIIPRGGESLIRRVAAHATVPVIKHYKGVCHTYVDRAADLKKADAIVFNAKVQRPATCNAMETLLVHRQVAARFLPVALRHLQSAGVELRGDAATRRLVPGVTPATAADWSAEYLDLILAVKVVGSECEAIEHINRYGTAHSDAIVTEQRERAQRFLEEVDSACVYVNASTRFTDGFQFGLGAEIGISTEKIHARGPMGLEELTTYKYEVIGNGQIRQ